MVRDAQGNRRGGADALSVLRAGFGGHLVEAFMVAEFNGAAPPASFGQMAVFETVMTKAA
jgi:hypothetical protein